MDFSKASNSISHHLTSIFPENLGWVGRVKPAWVSRPERPKGAKDEVGARRAPQLEVGDILVLGEWGKFFLSFFEKILPEDKKPGLQILKTFWGHFLPKFYRLIHLWF